MLQTHPAEPGGHQSPALRGGRVLLSGLSRRGVHRSTMNADNGKENDARGRPRFSGTVLGNDNPKGQKLQGLVRNCQLG